MRVIRNVSLIVVFVLAARVGSADVLVDFDFSGLDGLTFGPLDATDSIDPGVTLVNGVESTGGHGIGGGGTLAGMFNWSGWINGGTSRDYMKVVLEPAEVGSQVTLTSMDLSAARNGGGAPSEWYVWIVDGNFMDEADLDIADALDRVDIEEFLPADKSPPYPVRTFDLGNVSKSSTFSIVMGAERGISTSNAGNLRFNELMLNGNIGEAEILKLEVNTATGATTILNDFDSVDINFYEVRSPGGSLDPNGWNSLDAQNIDASGGGGLTDGWDEAVNNTEFVLTEANLLGQSTLANGAQQSLGNAFDEGVGTEDVEFKYGLANGAFIDGKVVYVDTPGGGGDFDNSGKVDQGDLDLVLLNWGDTAPIDGWVNEIPVGNVGNTELDQVRTNWGNTSAAPASLAVPEPGTLCLFSLGLFGLATLRRR